MTEQIKTMRNFALAGHSGAGKTSLAEAMLFKAGGISRHGRVEDGNTAMDFLPEEISKQQSVSTSFFNYTYNKHDITLMDTPGDQNFFSAAKTCIPAADSVCLVIDGVDGPSAMTEEAADCAAEYNLPAVVFVNKLDRERSDFKSTVENAAAMFKKKIIITHLPVGTENDFKGVVDILTGTAYIYDEEGNVSKQEIPDDMKDEMEEAKAEFIENVAEMDDDLLERYLEGHEPTLDELKAAFRKGILDAEFYTAICGAAYGRVEFRVQDSLSESCLEFVQSGFVPLQVPLQKIIIHFRHVFDEFGLCLFHLIFHIVRNFLLGNIPFFVVDIRGPGKDIHHSFKIIFGSHRKMGDNNFLFEHGGGVFNRGFKIGPLPVELVDKNDCRKIVFCSAVCRLLGHCTRSVHSVNNQTNTVRGGNTGFGCRKEVLVPGRIHQSDIMLVVRVVEKRGADTLLLADFFG